MTDDPQRPVASPRSERAVLALALRDPSTVDDAITLGLDPGDFNDPRLRALWVGAVKDRQEGFGPDQSTVLERHERSIGRARIFPDFLTLSQMVKAVLETPAVPDHLHAYVEALQDFTLRRSMLRAARDVLAHHQSGAATGDLRAITEGVAGGRGRRGQGLVAGSDLLRRAGQREEDVLTGKRRDPQIRTGLGPLDTVLRYHRGHYGLIAARPSQGKSQLGLTIARGISETEDAPVLVIMVEMSDEGTEDRLLTSEIRERETVEQVREGVQRSAPTWGRVLFDFDSKTLAEVESSIRLAHARHGICTFVVDYLQKIRMPKDQSREREVSNASDRLCHLAQRLGLLGIVLAQLSRAVDTRPLKDRRPMLADLRESGSLEQDADSVLFLYRHAAYVATAKEPFRVEGIVGKQRNGRAQVTVPLWFKPGDGFFRARKSIEWD